MTSVLTVNAGSTSLKLESYDIANPSNAIADPPRARATAATTIEHAEEALSRLFREGVGAVAHRFVRMPDDAAATVVLDAGMERRIAECGKDAPLHDAGALAVSAIVRRLAPNVVQFAVSDSAFHRTMPDAATTYALPQALTQSGLRRRGYHGLSHEYAANRACALAHIDVRDARVVTAHLGGGSSLCAIRDGVSIDTTMGYTPLEGVPMATRSGSVDPGIIVHLLRTGMTVDELDDLLERRSGLLGLSGVSGDVRELIALPADAGARLALDVLAWRLRSSFGAMIAVLGGVDIIAFTGGIGEHASEVRAAALAGGLGMGAVLDDARNRSDGEGLLSADKARPKIFRITAREGWQLARAAMNVRDARVVSHVESSEKRAY